MRKFLSILAAFATLTLSACAAIHDESGYTPPMRTLPAQDPHAAQQFTVYDPIEGTNRRIYKFNAQFDEYVFLPLVDAYDFVIPDYVNDRISSFFSNIGEFRNSTNAVLQAEPDNALISVGRFAINSTVGLLGFYDPAKHIGLKQRKKDFGQTLARWGAGPGAYVMLPVLGPSNLRDTAGKAVDWLAFAWVVPSKIEHETAYKVTYYGLLPVNARANNDFRYNSTGSPFEYELVRFVTTQGRALQVKE